LTSAPARGFAGITHILDKKLIYKDKDHRELIRKTLDDSASRRANQP
jgi:hypothetical protein